MADEEGGPDMVSLRELAARLRSEGVATLTHQRISQLSRDDPSFPPVMVIGRVKAVDYRVARPYFVGRKTRQGQRTDLHPPASE